MYRSLGEPILQPQDLILTSLHIQPPHSQTEKLSTLSIPVVYELKNTSTLTSNRKQSINHYNFIKSNFYFYLISDAPLETTSNTLLTKQEIQISTKRYNAVKFGSTFQNAIRPENTILTTTEQKRWPKIDPDKHSYYKNLHEIQTKVVVRDVVKAEKEIRYVFFCFFLILIFFILNSFF